MLASIKTESLAPKPAERPPQRCLVITQAPSPGGVDAMSRFVVGLLQARGWGPVLAYYKPYRLDRKLSVPVWLLPFRAPRLRHVTLPGEIPAVEIGVRLPELESRRYAASRLWRQVIGEFDRIIVVSGSALAATAIVDLRLPGLAWLATPYDPDRLDRIKTMPWYRRILDRFFDAPRCRTIEKSVLANCAVVAISQYTAREFHRLAPARSFPIVPVPVDTDFFCPGPERPVVGRVGFVGRFGDPRKNLALVLDAVKRSRRVQPEIGLTIVGDGPQHLAETMVRQYDLGDCVTFHVGVARAALPGFYRQFDVLVLPSLQEGLGIVGIEAMACGTPVIATRCGGPEEYIVAGENGYLADFDADDLARRILQVVNNRGLRDGMAALAPKTASRYSVPSAAAAFWEQFTAMDTDQYAQAPDIAVSN